jgi:3-methyladenine DNA glycosylase AlkD
VPRPPRTPLADELLARLDETYRGAADPVRAAGARAYMREQFPFLGIPSPRQAQLNRTIVAGLAKPDETDLTVVALECWARDEREFQYFACAYLRRHVAAGTPRLLPTVRTLITTKSWWDTVDTLAAHTVGPLVAKHPSLQSTMDAWIEDDNMWLARTAILHQLQYKDRTDAARLFRYCTARASHPDFFIRKAIGWALRQYAYTDAAAVRDYLERSASILSPLSVREAAKHL